MSCDLPATKLAKMTSQDMASEERKNADKKIMEENMFKSLGAEEQQAETDAFQCGRCKQVSSNFCLQVLGRWQVLMDVMQRKCRYRQAQTRSADEPMTVSPFSSRVHYSVIWADPYHSLQTFVTCAHAIPLLCDPRLLILVSFTAALSATTGGSSLRAT